MAAEIVRDAEFLNEEEDIRIVRLSASYGYTHQEQYVNLRYNRVVLHKLSSAKKPRQWELSAAEMDTLVYAWTQFKADRDAAWRTENARQEALMIEAFALAEPHHISIQKTENDFWFVYWPTGITYGRGTKSADAVLDKVKAMIEHLATPEQPIAPYDDPFA